MFVLVLIRIWNYFEPIFPNFLFGEYNFKIKINKYFKYHGFENIFNIIFILASSLNPEIYIMLKIIKNN